MTTQDKTQKAIEIVKTFRFKLINEHLCSQKKFTEEENKLGEALQHLIQIAEEYLKKSHIPHKHLEDIEEHDRMTTSALAEHLGVDLWIVMEVTRWADTRPRPKGDNND